MTSFQKLFLLLPSITLGGCTQLGLALVNATTPAKQAIQTTVAYGEHEDQQVDIFQPNQTTQNAPVVVFFHGGYWNTGTRAQYRFVGRTLAAQGFVAVVAGYRRYPEIIFPAFMHDATAAIKWVQAHIQDYGGNPQHIVLSGHSSGAHIASLVVLDQRYLGESANQLAGVVALAGPSDFLPPTPNDDEKLGQIFPDASAHKNGNTIHFVRGDAPPFLLLHGADDTTVKDYNSRVLAEKIRAAGGQATLSILANINHTRPVLSFTSLYRSDDPILKQLVAFVQQVAPAR